MSVNQTDGHVCNYEYKSRRAGYVTDKEKNGSAGQGDRRVVHHPPTSALGGKERRQTHLILPLHQGSGLGSGPQAISQTVYPSRLDQKAWASKKLMGNLFQSKTSGVCGWGRMRLKRRSLQP